MYVIRQQVYTDAGDLAGHQHVVVERPRILSDDRTPVGMPGYS